MESDWIAREKALQQQIADLSQRLREAKEYERLLEEVSGVKEENVQLKAELCDAGRTIRVLEERDQKLVDDIEEKVSLLLMSVRC